MEISALVLDMLVNSCKVLDSLPAPAAGFLPAADFSLYSA